MNKIYHIICVFILATVIYPLRGENDAYKALVSQDKQWNVCVHESGVNGPYDAFDYYNNVMCYFSGDTIVNDTKYYKFYTDREVTSLIREDIEQHKVYIVPIKCRNSNDNTEYILYDYDVKVGDIIQAYSGFEWCQNCYQPQTNVVSIEFIDGRKHIHVERGEADFHVQDTWIEGIGGLGGPDKPYGISLCGGMTSYELLICQKDEEVIYENKGCKCEQAEENDYFPIGMKWVNYSKWYTMLLNVVEEKREVVEEKEINGRTYKMVKGQPIDVDDEGTQIHMSFGSSLWFVDGKKIYGMGMGKTEEDLILMYDFSLEEGDVIDSYKSSPSTVIKTDSVVLENGLKAKRIFYDNRDTDIEYIGSVSGFVFPKKQANEDDSEPTPIPVSFMGRWFCYCAIGDEIIYKTGESVCDEPVIAALNEVPADELLTILGNVLTVKGAAEVVTSAVFSADGRQVLSFSGSTADISALPSGLYILRATTPDGKTLTAKFVK